MGDMTRNILEQAEALCRAGIITKHEFEEQKRQVMTAACWGCGHLLLSVSSLSLLSSSSSSPSSSSSSSSSSSLPLPLSLLYDGGPVPGGDHHQARVCRAGAAGVDGRGYGHGCGCPCPFYNHYDGYAVAVAVMAIVVIVMVLRYR
jgi:hypothetical protein